MVYIMKDGILTVNIDSITNTKQAMDIMYNELLSMLNKYGDTIEDSKNIYDTESATLYRTVAISYVDLVKKYLDNDLKPYIDKLDEIKTIYLDEYNSISDNIEGGQQ